MLGGVEDIGGMQRAFEGKCPWPYQTHCYINSGVLIIDLVRWRSGQWEEKCLDYFKHPIYLQWEDQDVLNFVLKDVIKLIPHKWNGQMYWLEESWCKYHAIKKLIEILKISPVVHYTTASKPWCTAAPNLYFIQYRKFASTTFWKDHIYTVPFCKSFKIFIRYLWRHPNFIWSFKFYNRIYYNGILGLVER